MTVFALSLLTRDPAPSSIVSLKLSTDSAARTLGLLLETICTLILLVPELDISRDVRLALGLDEFNGISLFAPYSSVSLCTSLSVKIFLEFLIRGLWSFSFMPSDNASLAFSLRLFNFSSFFTLSSD